MEARTIGARMVELVKSALAASCAGMELMLEKGEEEKEGERGSEEESLLGQEKYANELKVMCFKRIRV